MPATSRKSPSSPHHDLYPAALRHYLDTEGKGPAWLNRLSEQVLGYPALLITTQSETQALLDRIEKEQRR